MKRREFISLLGGAAAAWPLAARAQQPAMPVIGYFNSATPEAFSGYLSAFRQGLKESGYVESENVAIEYRWAQNQPERLPELAADLVRRQVKVIAAQGAPASIAACRATATIPIVFGVPEDPVRLGLVASLAHPGGNATGVNFFSAELAAKRLDFLRQLVPSVNRVAVLLNPAEPTIAAANLRDAEAAASAMAVQFRVFNASTIAEIDTAFAALAGERPDALLISSGLDAADRLRELGEAACTLGKQLHVINASTATEIDAAFAAFAQRRPDALIVVTDAFTLARRYQLAALANRYALPTIYSAREHVLAGGLMSYSTSLIDAYYQKGIYTGQILKGAKPADLPVAQPTRLELVINLATAKAIGLEIPPMLLARADEVIE